MLSLTPEEVKALSPRDARDLCARVREELVETVPRTGGHLASNLGVVEISAALVRVMDLPREKVVYDTGHQCYVHKLLTGRGERFETLRSLGGLSGFPKREESEFDAFGTGHSGTGVSAALGFARANRLAGKSDWTVAVIGDGAFTCGEVFEALNNVGRNDKLIVILNDNGMSISRSSGALKRALNRLRTAGYYRVKDSFHGFLLHLPWIGAPLARFFKRMKDGVKRLVLPENNLFEQFGLYYFGPADGNDLATVEFLLREARTKDHPSLIHLCTKKGKGLRAAENDPSGYHGLSPRTGTPASGEKSFTDLFGEALTDLAARDDGVVALTAAMQSGVGLDGFAARFPRRFFDTGIAEEHAMTFATALAAAGKKPVFAVYSTFFQRAFDQMIHDAALQKLPVTVCLDRAGITGEDGATHHGVLDLAMAMPVPGLKVYAPISGDEVKRDLELALAATDHPTVLRWGKGRPDPKAAAAFPGKSDPELLSFPGEKRLTVITFGRTVTSAMEAAEKLSPEGIGVDLVRFHCLKGFDRDGAFALLSQLTGPILLVEEGVKTGGFSQTLLAQMTEAGIVGEKKTRIRALDDPFVPHGSQQELLRLYGFDAKSIEKEGRNLAQTGSIPS